MILNIHAGHGLSNGLGCGAVNILDESVEARKVKDKVIALLKNAGHTVYDCTYNGNVNKDTILTEIIKKCNEHTVDLDVSIHLNSGRKDEKGDGKTGGVEVWGWDDKTKEVGESVCKEISDMLKVNNRGFKIDKTLRFINSTKAKAILIECCFVDDKDDAEHWNPDLCAKAIVKGITGKEIAEVNNSTIATTKTLIATVNDFKRWLNDILKINLTIDNKFSANDKKAAIMEFQKLAGITTSGIWDDASYKKALDGKTHMRKGNEGDLVKLLQGMMIVNNIYFGELHGRFDENTENTVLYFQNYWKLNNHKVAGTQVWCKLFG